MGWWARGGDGSEARGGVWTRVIATRRGLDSVYTITRKIPKKYPDGVQVYGGLHDQLRNAEIA